jgi:hypothetical protein
MTIENGRVSFRVNATRARHINKKIAAGFGGNVSDYMNDLVQRDIDNDHIALGRAQVQSEEVKDPQEWMRRTDEELAKLKSTMDTLLGIREEIRGVMENQVIQRT